MRSHRLAVVVYLFYSSRRHYMNNIFYFASDFYTRDSGDFDQNLRGGGWLCYGGGVDFSTTVQKKVLNKIDFFLLPKSIQP